jgi:hypothetical protein
VPFAVQIGVAVGQPSAVVLCGCGACADRLHSWLAMNHMRSRVVEVAEESSFHVTGEGVELGEVVVQSYRDWRRRAMPGRSRHKLSVVGAAA